MLSNEEKKVENTKETVEEAKALKEEVKARETLEAVWLQDYLVQKAIRKLTLKSVLLQKIICNFATVQLAI